ncbi:hypothetical protein BN11_1200012 [Nostocoides australiense Ben110]|uniref:Uncharacterized protein n=1 Tax=Nostocoides australiense Ben110 TaxID=1193182 RepID=W6K0Z7_9MICO|nr:hypothetical protein BN11_1200012 [Tetrasphaera australiensis Ben110]
MARATTEAHPGWSRNRLIARSELAARSPGRRSVHTGYEYLMASGVISPLTCTNIRVGGSTAPYS